MTAEQAIQILESGTGYMIIAEDIDKDTLLEAVRMAIDALKEKTS